MALEQETFIAIFHHYIYFPRTEPHALSTRPNLSYNWLETLRHVPRASQQLATAQSSSLTLQPISFISTYLKIYFISTLLKFLFLPLVSSLSLIQGHVKQRKATCEFLSHTGRIDENPVFAPEAFRHLPSALKSLLINFRFPVAMLLSHERGGVGNSLKVVLYLEAYWYHP